MLTFAISSLPFAPLCPQCRVLPDGGEFFFREHSFSYCCKAYAPAPFQGDKFHLQGQVKGTAWKTKMLPAFVPFRFPGQQHRIAQCQVALIEQFPGTFCDHLCHRSHFGSRYSWGRCGFAVLFGATTPKSLSKALSKV